MAVRTFCMDCRLYMYMTTIWQDVYSLEGAVIFISLFINFIRQTDFCHILKLLIYFYIYYM